MPNEQDMAKFQLEQANSQMGVIMEDTNEEWGTMKFDDGLPSGEAEPLPDVSPSVFNHDYTTPMDQLARRSFHGGFPPHEESERTSRSGE